MAKDVEIDVSLSPRERSATTATGNPDRAGSFATLIGEIESTAKTQGRASGISSAAFRAGALVRSMRRQAGLSQTQLAERLSVSQARISELEAGLGSQGPTWDVMERVAAACGTSIGIQALPSGDVASGAPDHVRIGPVVVGGLLPRRSLIAGRLRGGPSSDLEIADAVEAWEDVAAVLEDADSLFDYVRPLNREARSALFASASSEFDAENLQVQVVGSRYIVATAEQPGAEPGDMHKVNIILEPVAVAGQEEDIVAWPLGARHT